MSPPKPRPQGRGAATPPRPRPLLTRGRGGAERLVESPPTGGPTPPEAETAPEVPGVPATAAAMPKAPKQQPPEPKWFGSGEDTSPEGERGGGRAGAGTAAAVGRGSRACASGRGRARRSSGWPAERRRGRAYGSAGGASARELGELRSPPLPRCRRARHEPGRDPPPREPLIPLALCERASRPGPGRAGCPEG